MCAEILQYCAAKPKRPETKQKNLLTSVGDPHVLGQHMQISNNDNKKNESSVGNVGRWQNKPKMKQKKDCTAAAVAVGAGYPTLAGRTCPADRPS